MTESLIAGGLQVAASLGVSWLVARWVDCVYRGNEPSAEATTPSVLTRS
jgi:hypothetical protein